VWGRVAFWLFIASPFMAAPFAWGAGVAFLFVQMIVLTLLGVGMIQARILPRAALTAFAFSPLATLALALVLSLLDRDAGPFIPVGLLVSVLGIGWVGVAMWREPALDVRGNTGAGPFAAA
jgi:hypothetical protein